MPKYRIVDVELHEAEMLALKSEIQELKKDLSGVTKTVIALGSTHQDCTVITGSYGHHEGIKTKYVLIDGCYNGILLTARSDGQIFLLPHSTNNSMEYRNRQVLELSERGKTKPPFEVEDYRPLSEGLYRYTLWDTKMGQAIAPLTSKQGADMKLLLQLWWNHNAQPNS